MEVQAISRHARMSPAKVRQVARTIVGSPASDALERLGLISRKSAFLLAKTLKSAIANAENNHNLSSDSLYIASVHVDQGMTLKRFRPAARGQAKPYKKRTSHIKVVLSQES